MDRQQISQTSKSGRVNFQETPAEEHEEGAVAKFIEHKTAKLPSDMFLWAAGLSVAGSLALQLTGMKDKSLFVAQWVPSLLLLGVYNKIVKVAGSDRTPSGQTIH